MVYRPLTRARLLEVPPDDRLTFLETARHRIDAEIERLRMGDVPLRNSRSRRYHLQVLYERRQKLADLARAAGYGGWIVEPAAAD